MLKTMNKALYSKTSCFVFVQMDCILGQRSSQSHKHLVPVVQKVDNAIHQINHYPAIVRFVSLTLIHWIAIYPVDSIIQSSNNRGLYNIVTNCIAKFRLGV